MISCSRALFRSSLKRKNDCTPSEVYSGDEVGACVVIVEVGAKGYA